MEIAKTYKLFLDDIRSLEDAYSYTGYDSFLNDEWKIVRNYDEFVEYIQHNKNVNNSFPDMIAFDHDLSIEDQESWLPIKCYEKIYEVSNLGRIRRISIEKGTSGGILKPDKNESGLIVMLRNKGDDKKYLIHKLVLETFNGINEDKLYVNHKDGNRWNNKINNLEWCTNSENVKHSHDFLEREYTAYGENHNNSKTVSKYSKENKYLDTYGSVNEAARQEEITFTNIAKNARGERKSAGGFIWKYENKLPTINSKIKHIKKEDKNYIDRFFIPELKEKTGMDCANWLIEFCMDNKLELPRWVCHSMNPAGRDNINFLLLNYKKFQNTLE